MKKTMSCHIKRTHLTGIVQLYHVSSCQLFVIYSVLKVLININMSILRKSLDFLLKNINIPKDYVLRYVPAISELSADLTLDEIYIRMEKQ